MIRARFVFPFSGLLPRGVRWPAILAISVLLHLGVFAWIEGRLALPLPPRDAPEPLNVTLIAPPEAPPAAPPSPAESQPAPQPAAPKPQPKPKPRPKPRPKPVSRADPAPVQQPAMPAVPPVPAETAPPPPVVPDEAPSLAEVMPELEFEASAPRLLWQTIDLPPSAELHYLVLAEKDEQKWYGNGVFHWETDGRSYRLAGKATAQLLFFKLDALNFASEGIINEYGLAPLRYSEKTRNKPETVTAFEHEAQRIRFSSGSPDHPLQGGEQDRSSVLWQLAGIARAAPDQVQAGATLEVVVAGPRDAQTWQFRVLGLEPLQTAEGTIQAWRIARTVARRSGERRIDVWLAPAREWYPVRIRQTEDNTDTLELTLDTLRPLGATQPPINEQQ